MSKQQPLISMIELNWLMITIIIMKIMTS